MGLRSGLLCLLVSTAVLSALRGQDTVTWSEHIAPVVYANCTTCHRPGEAAPFPLTSCVVASGT